LVDLVRLLLVAPTEQEALIQYFHPLPPMGVEVAETPKRMLPREHLVQVEALVALAPLLEQVLLEQVGKVMRVVIQ
jgi:hypothetical protein